MKRLFVGFLGASVYLALFMLEMALDTPLLSSPSVNAAVTVSVGTQQVGEMAGSVLPPGITPLISEPTGVLTSVVSCLGDSITNGFPYAGTENTYPAQLQVMLDTAYGSGRYEVSNHGVNGYRTDQILSDLQTLNWMAEDPGFVLLMAGGNDLAQEILPDLSNLNEVITQTVAEMQAIVNVVAAHTNADGSHPQIIVSAYIPNLLYGAGGSAAVGFYNSRLDSELTGVDLWFWDNWDDFYDPNTAQARPSLMYDAVHPNADGYAVLAENWFEAIDSLVMPNRFYLPLILRNG